MDNNRRTTIINLYGGPGTGKSTSAAFFYYLLKTQGKSVELVREYVKDWAYEARQIIAYDQIYFLGKQIRRESLLYSKVDFIVTDSPVLMNLYYAQRYATVSLSEGVRAASLAFYRQALDDGHRHIHLFLKRDKPYISEGRYQSEEEAIEIDHGIKRTLEGLRIPFIECSANELDLLKVLDTIR